LSGNESTAKILGYSGLIPFIILSIAGWLQIPFDQDVSRILVTYAAIIFSFMGAVHWGIAISSKQDGSKYLIVSVLPALMAWPALLVPQIYALLLLLFGFIALYAYDRSAEKDQQLPGWYLPMRKQLTIVVVICLSGTLLSSILYR
jgi:positive regulator of sigma E activity